jgi:putative ABC transport system ATP-binding protein
MNQEVAISVRGVSKVFSRGEESLTILRDLALDIPKGSFQALMGPSGSGKSTLLNLIAGLDRATSGSVTVFGVKLEERTDGELAAFRARHVGIVFQAYNLIPVLTALENVELPLLLTSMTRGERRERAETALRIVGLSGRASHLPTQLSGGQEQRVAIARAIVCDPDVIIADEPTGDLDKKSAEEVLELFSRLNGELGKTIVMVTHDPAAAAAAHVIRRLDKGALS